MKKTLDYYLGLPYKIELQSSPEGGYVATIPDLPGCISQGETIAEAVEMIEDAKNTWLEVALEEGFTIPEPLEQVQYSGRFNVRVPKSLHKTLAESAARENVSLNQYIVYSLTKSLGMTDKALD